MNVEDVLSRLENVQPRGPGSSMASCPAHDDKTPSLSVRERDDGMILLWCFGGCGVDEIVAAMGLELQNLFPDSSPEHGHPHQPRCKPRIDARDLIRAMRHQLLVVSLGAEQLGRGEALSDEDRTTLDGACGFFYGLLQEVEDVT